ncbi:DedD protein [Marinomonas alcarazii]|uniref:DedD protein n=1 Tax=Marinomonas alcarazii TaxID=491949 RepID=A0A318V7I8_9GAMM|nr:SPOR domain-containing protein [Marinomonas alcarazii]PYF84666.1 DedD protein [Marinomonas alcarazii]
MIDRTITYRLIGAGIMVLSASIILPLILDGERPEELDMQVQVTSPPAFSPIEIAPAQPVDSLPVTSMQDSASDSDEIELIPVPKPAKDVSQVSSIEPEEPASSAKAPVEKRTPTVVADRWTLQIATFKSKDNATRLVEKLKAAKYDAYSLTTNSLYKVYVGPELKREVSDKLRDEIKKEFSLSGIVVKYSVN